MRKLVRTSLLLAAAVALALTGCRPPLNLVQPNAPGFLGGWSDAAQQPQGYGGMDVAIKWPPPVQRATQAIPAVANTLHLKVSTREGVVKASRIFNRPATTESLVSTASLIVGVGTSLVVEVNAYREQIATDSAIPTAERIIAQGVQENVTITLNATSSVQLKLDPDVTIAGRGGVPSLGLNEIPWAMIDYDPRGPAIWTELNNPEHLTYDPVGKYLYFTERPDPGRPGEGYRVMRLSLNTGPATGSYGVMTLVAGGALLDNGRLPESVKAPYAPITNLRGVASDTSGNLYFAERTLNRVRKIAANQVVTTFAANLQDPDGLLVHGDRLYVAERGRGHVRAYDLTGRSLWDAGGGSDGSDGASSSFVPLASASIPQPTALAASGNTLFVASAQGRVHEIDLGNAEAAGTACVRTLTAVGGSLPSTTPRPLDETTFGALGGIAVSGGTLYLSDATNRGIWQVGATSSATLDEDSGKVAGFGEAGLETGRFSVPGGLLLVGTDLYVCDTGNHRVERIDLQDPAHPVTTHFAGRNDGRADVIDGPSSDGDHATLYAPLAIATRSGDADLVVADAGSSRLRRVSAEGILSTLAGFWSTERLARGVGGLAHQLHLGDVAGLCLHPMPGAKSPSLYVLTSDQTAEAGGQGLYRINGLDHANFDPTTYSLKRVDPVVTTEMLFENMLTRLPGSYNRVVEGPTSVGIQPLTKEVVFSVAEPYHLLMKWDGYSYELTYGVGSLPDQGYYKFAGTGPGSYNGEGPATLVQLSQPRRLRFDAEGNCYLLAQNAGGQTIVRRVDTKGIISTIAGPMRGNLAVPPVAGPGAPVPAVQANIGNVSDFDLDSQGNLYLATGARILRFDQRAATITEVYNAQNRTFQSIAFDENDAAIIFTFSEEPKIKKVYLPRLF